jgi:hypothetical protein
LGPVCGDAGIGITGAAASCSAENGGAEVGSSAADWKSVG